MKAPLIALTTKETIKILTNRVQELSYALLKISQMSDSGSHEITLLRMKEIASEALKVSKIEKL